MKATFESENTIERILRVYTTDLPPATIWKCCTDTYQV